MKARKFLQIEIQHRLKDNPVVGLLGPRQCGKTTLARLFKCSAFFDLEDPRDLAQLENPMQAFNAHTGLIVIDEIQKRPDLFPVLRVIVDEQLRKPRSKQIRFLILGSASRDLLQQSSETLAGRISYIEMGGFQWSEAGQKEEAKLWLRGGLPRSFLARSESVSYQWRQDYVKTFLERDIPQLGIHIPSATLHRFWTMIAHYHGQILQQSEISRSFGISEMTVHRYLEILEGTFMVRLLRPWSENLGKRVVKRPKLYISDSGLFHGLLQIKTHNELYRHPKLGASWEGFVFHELESRLRNQAVTLNFWATHAGAELDFLFEKGRKRYGVEVKFADAPKLTPSMRHALEDLQLQRLFVVYPGSKSYSLHEKVMVMPLSELLKQW